jgi:hypothetical protein
MNPKSLHIRLRREMKLSIIRLISILGLLPEFLREYLLVEEMKYLTRYSI